MAKHAQEHGGLISLREPASAFSKEFDSAYGRLANVSHVQSECQSWFGGLDPVHMDLILQTQIMLLLAKMREFFRIAS